MARQFLTNLDLVGNQLLNAVVQNLASAPTSPTAGLVYFDTTLHEFGCYSGTAWVYSVAGVLTVTAGNTTITIGGTAQNPTIVVNPANISLSALGVPTAAVSFNGQQATNLIIEHLASAPGSPVAGRVYFDTTLNEMGYYTGTAWIYTVNGVLSVSAGNSTITIGGTASAPTIAVNPANIPISSLGAASATVNLSGQLLTGIANATNPTDAVNLGTLLTYVNGLTAKDAVAYATTAALPANTYSNGTAGVGATLTATANAALSVDGVAVVAGQRLLVKNEVAPANDGIYVVSQAGTGSNPYILTRSADANSAALLSAGILVPIEAPTGSTAGTANNGAVFLSLAEGPFTVGTSSITFAQVGAVSTYSAGTGLTLTGSVFSLTIPVTVASGGTGATTAAGARTNLSSTSSPLPQKFVVTVGNGTLTTFTVNHNLGQQQVQTHVFLTATNAEVMTDIVNTDANNVTITVSGLPAAPASNALTVVVEG